tara:strand:- start:5807 stop:6238 length:432 start_codon:yes stop_codon:yes gene_type:complete
MQYNLNEIFQQALKDDYAASLNGNGYHSMLVYGIKIVKDTEKGTVEILNTMANGNYYKPVSTEELELFLKKGWRYAVYIISLSNYRTKLDKIELRIKDEISGKNSLKLIQHLKSQRENVLEKYIKINYKLNQIKNGEIKSNDI